MALNTLKCNHLTPLGLKGLTGLRQLPRLIQRTTVNGVLCCYQIL